MTQTNTLPADNTYRLLEAVPYPRSPQAGPTVDATGVPLHGAYQRRLTSGYQSALINNGTVLCRYEYRNSSQPTRPQGRHSYANLALCGGFRWLVPHDSPRPVTDYPAAEYPHAWQRPLWESHAVHLRLLAGLKPAGLIHGHPDQVAAWQADSHAAGLISRQIHQWTNGLGQPQTVAILAHAGPLLTNPERAELSRAYAGTLPATLTRSALRALSTLTGEDLLQRDLANPRNAQELIITGHAFGYPPATTAACILGTHS